MKHLTEKPELLKKFRTKIVRTKAVIPKVEAPLLTFVQKLG